MQQDIRFAAESRKVKKTILYHKLGSIMPMAKRFTREQQLENLKIQSGADLLRSFQIINNLYDGDNEQSVWEYNAVKKEMLRRMSY